MSSSRTRPSRLLALVTIVLLVVGVGPFAAGAQIDSSDDDSAGTSVETTTTERDLLVPGDGSDGAQSTTTPSTSVVQASEARGDGLSETTAVWAIVGGLLAVAIGILFWTVRYWRKTAPGEPPRRATPPKRPRPPAPGGGTRREPNTPGRPPTRKIEPGATTRTPAERAAVRSASSRKPASLTSGSREPIRSRANATSADGAPRPARRRPIRPDDTDGRTPIRR